MTIKYLDEKPAALFIGRYSPFHNGHKFIIDQALDEGKKVLIAVRERPLTNEDPFSTEQRISMICAVYPGNVRVQVIKIPDIESVNIGRDVGYALIQSEITTAMASISATDIREDFKLGGENWKNNVPEAVVDFLKKTDAEGRHQPIYETNSFTVSAYGRPHVSREEGGHIVISAKEDIHDRTELRPAQAKEYIRLSMLIGEAMGKALNIRGIPVVKINYADNGNWAFKANKKPHLHMHIFGRASDAVNQIFPEAVKLPARESGFYDDFHSLNSKDINEIITQINILEKQERYSLSNW